MHVFICLLLTIICTSCGNSPFLPFQGTAQKISSSTDRAFSEYWYDGQAEINIFEVRQARYADIHPGKTVLIFVTEDFLIDKQVKNEHYTGERFTSILKTNSLWHFITGLYDYSIMTSVFTPVDRSQYPHSVKVTGSAQDWCGQSFSQMNLDQDQYRIRSYSYFEEKGDQEYLANTCLLEDEILALIRLDPAKLPTGEIEVIPGMTISRLMNAKIQPFIAHATLTDYEGNDFPGNDLSSYLLKFQELNRSVEVVFTNEFPFEIIGWRDTYPTLSGEIMTSTAVRTHKSKSKYWELHALKDSSMRSRLGLQ